MACSANLHPVCPDCQQQPRGGAHRAVRNQPGAQFRSRLAQRLQQVRREPKQLRCQQPPDTLRQNSIQTPRRRHQYRLSAIGITEPVPAVPKSCQLCGTTTYANSYGQPLPPDAMAGSRPEYDGYQQICRGRRCQQNFSVHIRIKYTVGPGQSASGQQAQPQNAPSQSTGQGKQQQRQPQQVLLSSKSHQGHQDARRQLGWPASQKTASGQKYRHSIDTAQDGRQRIPPSPQRHARQPGGDQTEEIIHHAIEQKYGIHIDYRHTSPPLSAHGLFSRLYYRAGIPEKPSQKGTEKSRTNRPALFIMLVLRHKARS